MTEILKVKLSDDAVMPTRGTEQAAGIDLYATKDVCIWSGATEVIDTGVAMELPEGTFGAVFARSGLSTKQGLGLANGVAVIDEDFRGTIKVPLHNHSGQRQWVKKGERIAQLVVIPYKHMRPEAVEELSDTVRGTGGFGSTGR